MTMTIFDAIAAENLDELKKIITETPDSVRERDQEKSTPLHRAAEKGNIQMVKLLVNAGADPNAPDKYGYPAINAAVWDGHQKVIQFLIDTLDQKSSAGKSFIIMAASCGHLAIVKMAIEHGGDVDADDGMGQTPLIYAIRKNHPEIVQELLLHNANVNVVLTNGETPLSIAKEDGLKEIVNLLKNSGASKTTKKVSPKEFVVKVHRARIPGSKTLSLKEANGILKGLHSFKEETDRFEFIFCDGDMDVKGNLELDADQVLIVRGNLKVQKSLIDFYYNEDDYSQLFVLGNLSAHDLITGSPIYVQGDVSVDGMIYANSFGLDSLKVKGNVSAKVLIDEGHELDCRHIHIGMVFASVDRLSFYGKSPNVKKIGKEIFSDPQLYADFVDPGRLVQFVRQGKAVVKPKYFKATPKTFF